MKTMTPRTVRMSLAAALSAALVSGCIGGRSPASYRGATAPPVVEPAEVGEAEVVPVGYTLVGRVRAECALTEGRESIDDEWLSDVDCTRFRLTEALRHEVALSGGDLLVGRTCLSARRVGQRVVIRCEARVARSGDDGPGAGGLAVRSSDPLAASLRGDDPSGVEAWRIRVRFEPEAEPTARAPRRADAVDEVAVLPLAAEPLGAVLVRCAEPPCSVEAVRAGVRVAAGRLGASHVGNVHCVQAGDKPRCLGEAALLDELPISSQALPH